MESFRLGNMNVCDKFQDRPSSWQQAKNNKSYICLCHICFVAAKWTSKDIGLYFGGATPVTHLAGLHFHPAQYRAVQDCSEMGVTAQ